MIQRLLILNTGINLTFLIRLVGKKIGFTHPTITLKKFLIITDLGVTNHFKGLRYIISFILSIFPSLRQAKNALTYLDLNPHSKIRYNQKKFIYSLPLTGLISLWGINKPHPIFLPSPNPSSCKVIESWGFRSAIIKLRVKNSPSGNLKQ